MKQYKIDFDLGRGIVESITFNGFREQAEIYARKYARQHHLAFKQIVLWEIQNV